MRGLSGKQQHVFEHLDRVASVPRKFASTSRSVDRFQLDGWDCTYQVTALRVKKIVRRLPGGRLERLPLL